MKNKFQQFIQDNLNPDQKKAVEQSSGIFQVIAGAGSGKTRVITSRIINLILEHEIPINSIIALTFTNKAGKEMEERIWKWLPIGTPAPFIGTFHSFCLKILKRNLDYNFTIMDEADQQKLIGNIIKKFDLKKKFTAKSLGYAISLIKNNQVAPTGEEFSDPMVYEIYKAYELERRNSKCLDFDDLIVETVRLFKKNPSFKDKFQTAVKHILVDEYQDTSAVQHELLKEMTLNREKQLIVDSLCIVGDEDQSIYSWRGATATNILNFKKDYPSTQTIKIEQNYRSVQPILHTANLVISNNKNRNEKKLWSERKANNRVFKIKCMSDYQESDIALEAVQAANNKKLSAAILYRTHFQSRVIEEALLKHSIPYTIVGGIQFYERKEIKDILSYLKLVVNPFDRISFSRIINCPTRKLGEKFQELFEELWNAEPLLNFKQLIATLSSSQSSKMESLNNFCLVFNNLDAKSKPSEAINQILNKTGYFNYLKDAYEPKEAEERIDNVKELIRAAEHIEETESKTVAQFLEEIALMQDKINNKEERVDHVKLMTLHAAKGLEFDLIMITGLEEGLLPSSRSLMSQEQIEEERRLFYVGITRAKEYLLLTHAGYRNTFGQTNTQAESRFLEEASSHLINNEDCSYWSKYIFKEKIYQFLGLNTPNFTEHVQTFKSFIPAHAQKSEHNNPISKASQAIKQTNSLSNWKINQPVIHPTFGVGIIQKLEQRGTKTFLTVKFKAEIKRIEASFLKS